VQYLLDKWFWRSWRLFSILTGLSTDYLTALDQRPYSFKEFMEEWIIDQYLRTLDDLALRNPGIGEIFQDELDIYHHMIYASAYTYRATLWFDFVVPSPAERKWLRQKYPKYGTIWRPFGSRWLNVGERLAPARRMSWASMGLRCQPFAICVSCR